MFCVETVLGTVIIIPSVEWQKCISGSRQSTYPRTGKEVLKLASVLSEDCPESDFCDVLISMNQHFQAKRKIIS